MKKYLEVIYVSTDTGFHAGNPLLTSGEESTVIQAGGYIGRLAERIYKAAYKGAVGCTGKCTNGLIRYEEGIDIPCPTFMRARYPNELKACEYAVVLGKAFGDTIKRALAESDVPLRHLSKIGKHTETRGLIQAVQHGCKGFLLLCGQPGTGKSFSAAYLCHAWLEGRSADLFHDRTRWGFVYDTARDCIGWYTAYEIAASQYREQKEIAKKYKILVIDDLGTENISPSASAGINYVISKRYDGDSDLATIVTCNMDIDDIAGRYGRRLADRFMEGGEVVVFGGPVIRWGGE